MVYMKDKGHLYSLAQEHPKPEDNMRFEERIKELEKVLFDKDKIIEEAKKERDYYEQHYKQN